MTFVFCKEMAYCGVYICFEARMATLTRGRVKGGDYISTCARYVLICVATDSIMRVRFGEAVHSRVGRAVISVKHEHC